MLKQYGSNYEASSVSLIQYVEELRRNEVENKKLRRLVIIRNILKPVLIGFLIGRKTIERTRELHSRNELIKKQIIEYCDRVLECIREQVKLAQRNDTYLTYENQGHCVKKIVCLQEDLAFLKTSMIFDETVIFPKIMELEKLFDTVLNYNKEFIKRRKKEYSHLWKKEHLLLDDQQQEAVVKDDKHNLVIAGAGSGKTEVLITRIAYLIERKPDGVRQNRILAIAYQNKDVNEIGQRLLNRYGIKDVNVKTFHKLGKDILEAMGKKFRHTDIIDDNKKHEIIERILKQKINTQPECYKKFLQYVRTLNDPDPIDDEEQIKEEHLSYMQCRPCFSIDNHQVRSDAEKEIMDFFLTQKIDGEPITIWYEPNTDGFRPDFYLPKYDLYIEHWSLTRNGEVPKWFNQTTEEYKKSMESKKQWFKEHDKLLVETYAYEYTRNNADAFIEMLKTRVLQALQSKFPSQYKFSPKTYEEIVEVAWGPFKTPTEELVNFIRNAKVNGLTPSQISDRLQNGKWSDKQLSFGVLAVDIFKAYENLLKEHQGIDFEDMINLAIEELTSNQKLCANIYDQILIDEYQDISDQRFKLIKTLLERNPQCKLFCVGDDWQSIMGFAGSDLNLFIDFASYFPNPAVTVISTNYRSIRSIVDAGADLIKNNAEGQISKITLSSRPDSNPIKVIKSLNKKEYQSTYYEQTADDCINRINEYLTKGCNPQEILILSRFMRTRHARGYRYFPLVRILMEEAKERNIDIAIDDRRPQNKIRLLTAHKSKGLEARVVFVLNAIKDKYGFPCEIEDLSIYAPARKDCSKQEHKKEERRLFYVTMTRAKEELIIYTWLEKSEFLNEIQKHTTEISLPY